MWLVRDILLKQIFQRPDQLAVEDPHGACSYQELHDGALSWAQALVDIGIKVQDRCLILLPNNVDFIRAHFAIQFLGGITVPCDDELDRSGLELICENSQPSCVLTDYRHYELFADVFKAQSGLTVFLVDEASEVDACIPGRGLFSETPRDFSFPVVDPSSVAVLMYTEGTMTKPKGVLLSHRNIHKALENLIEFVGYSDQDREVIVLPLSHSFGLEHVCCNLMCGGSVYVENGLGRPGRVIKAVERFRATGFPCTPTNIGVLLDHYALVVEKFFAKLKHLVIGSSPMPPERTAQLRRLLPHTNILVCYGLVEASRSTFVSLNKAGPEYYTSVGKAMADIELRVVNSQGQDTSPGEVGEVLIYGETLSNGYWNNQEATDALFVDGWLRSGDLGRLDEEGRLYLAGRREDQIEVGGQQVNPIEVEAFIRSFGGIRELAVVALHPGDPSQQLVAAMVAEPGNEIDLEALDARCKEGLAGYEVPSRYMLVPSIPRSNTGKVKRKELERMLLKQMELVQ